MIELDFSKSADGLIAAIAQDYQTNEVLMLAFINEDAWKHTLETGNATYWSRSRGKLWKKGESSGNIQKVHDMVSDRSSQAENLTDCCNISMHVVFDFQNYSQNRDNAKQIETQFEMLVSH